MGNQPGLTLAAHSVGTVAAPVVMHGTTKRRAAHAASIDTTAGTAGSESQGKKSNQ